MLKSFIVQMILWEGYNLAFYVLTWNMNRDFFRLTDVSLPSFFSLFHFSNLLFREKLGNFVKIKLFKLHVRDTPVHIKYSLRGYDISNVAFKLEWNHFAFQVFSERKKTLGCLSTWYVLVKIHSIGMFPSGMIYLSCTYSLDSKKILEKK